MSGAPRSAYTGGEFIAVRLEVVRQLGSWEAAGVWHRICWRAERDGCWVATVAEVAAEVELSHHKVKRVLAELREAGWIAGERASSRDRTIGWRPVWDDEPSVESPPYVERESHPPKVESPPMVRVESRVTPSSKTVQTSKTFTAAAVAAEAEQLPILVMVPAQAEPEPDAEFAAFWSSWPDKRDRKAAERAYRAARRRGVSAEVIAAGAAAHAPAFVAKMAAGERAFIPHAATWLNKERWNDPPPSMPRVNPDAAAVRAIMAGQPQAAPSRAVELGRQMMGLPATRQEELA